MSAPGMWHEETPIARAAKEIVVKRSGAQPFRRSGEHCAGDRSKRWRHFGSTVPARIETARVIRVEGQVAWPWQSHKSPITVYRRPDHRSL